MLSLLCGKARLFVLLALSGRRRKALGLCRLNGQECLEVLAQGCSGVLAGLSLGVGPRTNVHRPLRSCKRARAGYELERLFLWGACWPTSLLVLGLLGQSG